MFHIFTPGFCPSSRMHRILFMTQFTSRGVESFMISIHDELHFITSDMLPFCFWERGRELGQQTSVAHDGVLAGALEAQPAADMRLGDAIASRGDVCGWICWALALGLESLDTLSITCTASVLESYWEICLSITHGGHQRFHRVRHRHPELTFVPLRTPPWRNQRNFPAFTAHNSTGL